MTQGQMTSEQVTRMVADFVDTVWFYHERQGIAAVRVTIVTTDEKRRILMYPEDERE